ncbi:carboxymuconolactone decarboxylase family protein [Streptomyces aidingensis]|uniref:Alkylhydroperoxidase AhpD family core domain-containing protein n=1 Tax=Streptomyces aidingensis TaxID=910347 RepID=A0A1I1PB51_9ACTN|nr:carboxymuconolactone decarboxylase family protein [Streptomyces aidingensis]SFD07067.1 alkylhydroperoxidase AhpD family core domain-containing protein [Streptomyces aidingensis]
MSARMKNPATVLPEAMQAIMSLNQAVAQAGVEQSTLELVHLRASQINGCAFCVDYGGRSARKAGETEERLLLVSAWRDATCFTEAERAALALAESVTRLSDRSDPVPDQVWDEAARHYGERQLAALLLWISTTNVYNRLNVSTRQEPGSWG